MDFRYAMLVAMLAFAGCQGPGTATIPPPGTGSFQAPNSYYQPPGSTPPPFQPPSYGATSNPAPNFAPTAGMNLAANSGGQGAAHWQVVTRQPEIHTTTGSGGAIHPQTTLTSIRGTGLPATGGASTASTNGGLRDIGELPMVPVAGAPQPPPGSPLRPGVPPPSAPLTMPNFAAPITTPSFSPLPTTPVRNTSDPWRGR